jgi:hypothetical protein
MISRPFGSTFDLRSESLEVCAAALEVTCAAQTAAAIKTTIAPNAMNLENALFQRIAPRRGNVAGFRFTSGLVNQPVVDGVKRELEAVGNAQLVENIVEVILHRLLADE